ncbi:MAG: pyruvate kinase [Haloarculaceae archaeon]
MRNTKIVCTLGPASNDYETIRDLAEAGMSVARINASHGSREDRIELVEAIDQVNESTEHTVAAMLDLQGPEIRTGEVSGTPVLEKGSEIRYFEGDTADEERVGLSIGLSGVTPGDRILVDDGRIETTVTEVDGDEVVATVDTGGELESRRGVNVPGVDLGIDVVTESDRKVLEFGVEYDVDLVAASFVRNEDDIYSVRSTIEEFGGDQPIVAKVERADAVENLDGIIDASHGVMVARGDLGVECPLEDVPIYQKRIIRKCNQAGVPVITATEMLESMIEEPRPTRAEASDVANAVLDGTDAVMLSGETAVGTDPVNVVETMSRIACDVEGAEEYAEAREGRVPDARGTRTDAIARSARFLASDVDADAIVVVSETGYTARKAAKYRPPIPIVATTPDETVGRQLALSWGIIPVNVSFTENDADAVVQKAVQAALDTEALESGDTAVVISGMMTDIPETHSANMLKVHIAANQVARGKSVVPGLVSGPLYRIDDGDLTDVPEGAVVEVPAEFDGEFEDDVADLSGIVHRHQGMTSYTAIVARELSIPMVSDATVPPEVEEGTRITLDSERGVIYEDFEE